MGTKSKWLVFARLAIGWLFLYAGVTKIVATPAFSAAFYLKDAKTFGWLYSAMMNPSVLPIINWLVMWGLTLLGISLILGVMIRTSAVLGSVMMLLLYFPILDFPYPNAHAFIVDEHIIYVALLMALYATKEMQSWELASVLKRTQLFRKFPKFSAWL